MLYCRYLIKEACQTMNIMKMRKMMKPFERLDQMTRPGDLMEELDEGGLRCLACAHRCLLKPGRRGICGVRYNHAGVLMVPEGYVAGVQVDPIEKKPFNHFLPGSRSFSIAFSRSARE